VDRRAGNAEQLGQRYRLVTVDAQAGGFVAEKLLLLLSAPVGSAADDAGRLLGGHPGAGPRDARAPIGTGQQPHLTALNQGVT